MEAATDYEFMDCPMCGNAVMVDKTNAGHEAWCTKCGFRLEGRVNEATIRLLWRRMVDDYKPMHGIDAEPPAGMVL